MGWTVPSDRSTGDTITSAIWNENVGASGNSALLKTSVNNSGAMEFVDATELTIASGVITVTANYHKVDTEGDAASDDLDTITAGTNVAAGFILHLRVESAARTVVIKAGTGGADNLEIGSDVTLDEAYKTYSLVYDGANWRPLTLAPTFASLSPLTTRGDLLYGSSGTVTGTRLAVGDANSVLHTDGTDVAWRFGYPTTVLQKTAAYTATVADCGDNCLIKAHMTSAGAGFTFDLYAASGNAGKRITVIKETGDAYPLVVDANGSETINGTTTRTLYSQFDYITIICDGVNWWILDEKITIAYKTTLSVAQGVPTGVWTKILLDSVVTDTASAHASNCFTAPQDGWYSAMGHAFIDNYNGQVGAVGVWKNGDWVGGTSSFDSGGGYTSGPAGTIEFLSTGETIQLFAYQTRGSTVNVTAALQNASLRVIYLHT